MFYVVAGIFVVGIVFLIWAICVAPHGYQDETGFHPTPPPPIQIQRQAVQAHPAFAELRERYEWSDTIQAFPRTLKSGKPNPLFGVTSIVVKVVPRN